MTLILILSLISFHKFSQPKATLLLDGNKLMAADLNMDLNSIKNIADPDSDDENFAATVKLVKDYVTNHVKPKVTIKDH